MRYNSRARLLFIGMGREEGIGLDSLESEWYGGRIWVLIWFGLRLRLGWEYD